MKTDTLFKRAFNDALDIVAISKGRPAAIRKQAQRAARRQPHDGAQDSRRARRARRRDRQRTRSIRPPGPQTCPAVPRGGDHSDVGAGREALHGMDAEGQCAPGNRDQRARACATVRNRDDRHPRIPQPLSALRTDRKAAERRLGVQRLHARLRARAFRDSGDVRSCAPRGPSRRCPSGSPHWQTIEALREEHVRLLARNRSAVSRFLRSRQPVPPPDQLGRAEPLHRRLLRSHQL